MKYKIGFQGYEEEQKEELRAAEPGERRSVKSVVQVSFPDTGRSYAYFNDRFDLRVGDVVFVEGKMKGVQGVVTEVSHSFKIRLADYKRVVSVADTLVEGALYFGGSHIIAFDEGVIPYEKIRTWFLPPENGGEIAVGYGGESFYLDDLHEFKSKPETADRGVEYYNRNKVVYISVDGERGRAIVEGSRAYEVSFDYCDGDIGNLTCGCWCSYHCKHEFAALLQLRETLGEIEKNYGDEYERSDYFAAISKSVLLSYAMNGRDKGRIVLG